MPSVILGSAQDPAPHIIRLQLWILTFVRMTDGRGRNAPRSHHIDDDTVTPVDLAPPLF